MDKHSDTKVAYYSFLSLKYKSYPVIHSKIDRKLPNERAFNQHITIRIPRMQVLISTRTSVYLV